ncbi:EAL domain-containing protein [Thermostichus vulcanus]|uniref:EAL domain-containing protein n=1 Tax=Thermostichus vulcanus str. 'Rupite' TaxID=2813851 RepID=A0ABT0CA63_THEVL|nr:EAL domain-containing protein [Thermostichus vulcanus str. 'Rupite']
MPLLRTALLRRWLSVAPDTPVLEAIRCTAQRDPAIPAVVWVERGKHLLGYLSALDLLQALHSGIPPHTCVQDLTWREPQGIPWPKRAVEQELRFLLDAARLLTQQQTEALPVLDAKGHLKGILTPHSLLQALNPTKLLQLNSVEPWIQPLQLQAPADLSLGAVLSLLVHHRVTSLLLWDPQRQTPVGWIQAEQVLQIAQETPNWQSLPAQTHCLPYGTPLDASEHLGSVYECLRQEPSQKLLVVNRRAQVMGWVGPQELLHILLPEQLFLSHLSQHEGEATEELPADFLRQPGDKPLPTNLNPESVALDQFKRRWAEEALRKSESLRHAILSHIPAVIWLVDRELRYTYFSGANLHQFGIDPQAALGRTLAEVYGESEEGWHSRHHRLALQGIPCAYEAKVAGITYECRVDLLPNQEGVIGIAIDISERKEAEARLEHLAHYDPLTQLPNRSLFQRRLQEFLQQPHPLAVLFLDLDDFKTINDSLGHSAGDRVLQLIAKRLQEQVPAGDLMARMGGDEFTFILTHLDNPKRALNLAQSLLDTFDQPILLDNHELYVSGSIGISFYPQDATDLDSLVQYADAAMYRAKAQSRNSYQVHHSDPQPEALGRLTLESRLRRAIEQDQLQVLYQPQWDINGQKIVGAEALVRWDPSSPESFSPEQFIPLAEETGLILPLGEWVLRRACAEAQRWRTQGWPEITVAVNLSMRQFQQQDMVTRLKSILAETQLPAAALEVEITETTAAKDFEQTLEILRRLYHLGVKLAIDDFGTGYSSISYLKRFPLHKLKIDRSFIRDLNTTMVPLSRYEKSDIAVVAAIIDLGHSLDLRVAAEGVETLSQLDILQNLKCDEVQGFLLGRPVTATDFLQQLREHA